MSDFQPRCNGLFLLWWGDASRQAQRAVFKFVRNEPGNRGEAYVLCLLVMNTLAATRVIKVLTGERKGACVRLLVCGHARNSEVGATLVAEEEKRWPDDGLWDACCDEVPIGYRLRWRVDGRAREPQQQQGAPPSLPHVRDRT